MPARLSMSNDPTAIIVLGMHRSGTSAIARMLNLCGADLGRDLLPAKEDNERGFWENRALLALHERFLAETGLRWHDPASLPPDWRNGAAARRLVAALPQVLVEQFGDCRLFLVKDPRLSLLTPLWIEVLQARAVRPVFVITIRHPDEVAASLDRRDGLSWAKSRLLWLQNLLDAERATRAHPRVFVNYERVLADWRVELERITSALDVDWPNSGPGVDQQVDAFIAPSLRHHHSDLPTGPRAAMPDMVQQAYRIASAAGRDDPSASFEAFDSLDAAFGATLNLGGPVIADLSRQLAEQGEGHADEVERARRTIDAFAAEIAQAREAHLERDRLESQLRDALAARDDEIERARAHIDALAAELSQAREGFAAKEQEIARAADVVALKDREIDAARHSIDGFVDQLSLARATIAAKDREIDAARGNIDVLLAGLAAKDAEIDAARTNITTLAEQVNRAREGFSAKDLELDAARANINALVAEIDRARQAHAARDGVEGALRGELATVRESRWFQLGRALRLIGRDRP